jgi:hypothetical protein
MGNSDLILRSEHTFSANGRYETFAKVLDGFSGELLGYTYREEGNYQVQNSKLIMSDKQGWINDGSKANFSDLDQLISANTVEGRDATIALSTDKKILKWIFAPCGPADQCIANQPGYSIYHKVQ